MIEVKRYVLVKGTQLEVITGIPGVEDWRVSDAVMEVTFKDNILVETKVTVKRCNRCNYDNHRCHGCGTPLPHGTEVCDKCRIEYNV